MENENLFEQKLNLQPVHELATGIRNQLTGHIMGNAKVIDLLICAMLSDGHVLLEGVPGIGKTLLARVLSASVNGQFKRLQFTPDLMPSDLLGTMIFNQQSREFEYKKGPVFANVLLIDEINRAPAKTQSALFEAMEERQVSMEGITHMLPEPHFVIATQNPVEYEGTYRLPEAQLDRFIFKLIVDYPNEEDESRILQHYSNLRRPLNDVQKIAGADEIIAARKLVEKVTFSDKLVQYLVNIMQKTRHSNAIYLGASPRAALHIMMASKAIAAMNGRDFVSPEDIQFVLPHVLRHRILLTPEKEMEGMNSDKLIEQITRSVEVPR